MRRSGIAPAPRRGGALATLGGVLAIWLLLRVTLWEAPFSPSSLSVFPLPGPVGLSSSPADLPAAPAVRTPPSAQPLTQPLTLTPPLPLSEPPLPAWQFVPGPAPIPSSIPAPMQTSALAKPAGQVDFTPGRSPQARSPQARSPQARSPQARSPLARRGFAAASSLVAHVMLLQAGYRGDADVDQAPSPMLARQNRAANPVYAPQAAQDMRSPARPLRWSMDAWALWRQADDSPILSGRPSYGRSQAGAVIRYHLAPSSGHAPQVHLRASTALEGRQERELAFGASVRPVPAIPVRFAAEARASDTDRGIEPRVAAYAVSEFSPVGLPGGLTAEAYVQGGYVTGDFATPFVDGQARITRRLAGTDDFRLEAGGGAWGGAQEDARRLDVGPSAAIAFRVGPARGRVSADYRFRVAGSAEPASGPALTLSAGF